jgi:nitrite reductase/ring-hydroxylating ferredoxin subunit
MAKMRFGKVSDVPPGEMRKFIVKKRWVVIANVEGRFHAMDGRCSHMGGDLSKGELKDHVIQCPIHGAEYDIRTGKMLSGPLSSLLGKASSLRTYPLQVVGEDLMVEYDAE